MAKSKKLQILEKILRWMAKTVVKKYNPKIIGITGSVGKTSTKEAVFLALSLKYNVRKNQKNYNNEVGIPLTIIGSDSGENSVLRWLGVFLRWVWIVVLPQEYPEILILEMGVDHPGDMQYLAEFIPVEVGILTNVSTSHLEFFKDIEHIAKEKGKLIEAISGGGAAILHADDKRVMETKDKTKAQIISYGIKNIADITASDIAFNYNKNKPEGISFKLNYEGKSIPVRLNHLLAKHQVYSVLAALAASIHLKVNLVDALAALENYFSPSGRMNLIKGIKNSFVIDDTYNASPKSTVAAIDILGELQASRKIAVLGDMLELGKDLEKGHREVAQKLFEIKIDLFFAVGERMETAVTEIKRLGYPAENILFFENPVLAGKKLQQVISKDDLVLVKGSQGMRMEKIVEEIMAEPQKSKDILCRQSKYWLKTPFIKP